MSLILEYAFLYLFIARLVTSEFDQKMFFFLFLLALLILTGIR